MRLCCSLILFVCFCSQKGLKNVFDEAILAALEPPEPKKKRKCVLLWEAPPFPKHTPSPHPHTCIHSLTRTHTHDHTHKHRNTLLYIHRSLPPHTLLSCSAKAAWQHCLPQGRLGRKQSTKFQMIILCNNKQASPLHLEFRTEDDCNTANRSLWAQTGIQIPSLQVKITLLSSWELISSVQAVLWASCVVVFSQCQGLVAISQAPAPPSCLIGSW